MRLKEGQRASTISCACLWGGNQTEGKEKPWLSQTKRHTNAWKRGSEVRAGYHKKCNVTTTH